MHFACDVDDPEILELALEPVEGVTTAAGSDTRISDAENPNPLWFPRESISAENPEKSGSVAQTPAGPSVGATNGERTRHDAVGRLDTRHATASSKQKACGESISEFDSVVADAHYPAQKVDIRPAVCRHVVIECTLPCTDEG